MTAPHAPRHDRPSEKRKVGSSFADRHHLHASAGRRQYQSRNANPACSFDVSWSSSASAMSLRSAGGRSMAAAANSSSRNAAPSAQPRGHRTRRPTSPLTVPRSSEMKGTGRHSGRECEPAAIQSGSGGPSDVTGLAAYACAATIVQRQGAGRAESLAEVTHAGEPAGMRDAGLHRWCVPRGLRPAVHLAVDGQARLCTSTTR